MQEEHVVCYESRKIKQDEKKYLTHDLELAGLVHALKMWRHYLLGNKFLFKTDHHGSKYFLKQPNLNSRQEMQVEFLSD